MHLFASRSRQSFTAGLSFLISLAALATTTGQEIPRQPPTEPLEKYDNPPAPYVLRIETSPRMISQFGAFTSFQVNVDAQGLNILGDAANEPSITVDPVDLSK